MEGDALDPLFGDDPEQVGPGEVRRGLLEKDGQGVG